MAIYKRAGKFGPGYQLKLKGSDGYWLTETFERKADAEKREAELKYQKKTGLPVSNLGSKVTVSEFFKSWDTETRTGDISEGWRRDQIRMFHDYVEPVIGGTKLQAVTPALISRVLAKALELGRAPQTRLHIFNVMHKLFEDAVELFELLERNPVKKNLKPSLPQRESAYLFMEESIKLLRHVEQKTYQTAVWLQLYLGLRVGEVQALTWGNVDLEHSLVHVRRTYARKEKVFREFPKGKKWHSVRMPTELRELLVQEKARAVSEYVVTSPEKPFLCYDGYIKALRRYCKEIGLKRIGTHGLRHSTAEIWMNAGATRDDMRVHYAHSTDKVTDRYVHDRGGNLEKVANVIRLFPEKQRKLA